MDPEREKGQGWTQPHLRQAPGHHSRGGLPRRRLRRGGADLVRVESEGPGRVVLTKPDDLLDEYSGSLATGGRLRRSIRTLRDES